MTSAAVKGRSRQSGGAASPGAAAPVRRVAAPGVAAVPAYARGGLAVGRRNSPQEHEAEAAGRAVKAGAPAPLAGAMAGPVQRAAKPEDAKKPVQKAGKPEEEKQQAPVARAEKPEQDKPQPVQLAGKGETEKQQLPVQKAGKPEAEKKPAVQAAAKPVEEKQQAPVQRAARPEESDTAEAETEADAGGDSEEIERAAEPGAAEEAGGADAAQALAAARRGEGKPLPPGLRTTLEQSLGADLAAVRLHAGPDAARAAELLHARAFTQGSDIFLGAGESETDLELMGHEAAHVLQQQGGAPPVVQRAAKKKAEKKDTDVWEDPEAGKLTLGKDGKERKLEIAKLPMYDIKAKYHPLPLKLSTKKRKDNPTKQREAWEKHVRDGNQITEKIKKAAAKQKVLKDPKAPEDEKSNPRIWFFRAQSKSNHYVIGTTQDLLDRAVRPPWTPDGVPTPMQVDHKKEIQLSGGEEDVDRIDNLQLLDARTNLGSGNMMNVEIDKKIAKLRAGARQNIDRKIPRHNALRYESDATVTSIKKVKPPGHPATWEKPEDVRSGLPIEKLKPLSAAEIKSVSGKDNELVLFTNQFGGSTRKVPYDPDAGKATDLTGLKKGLPGFEPTKLSFKPGEGGTFTGKVYTKSGLVKPLGMDVPIEPMLGLDHAGAFSLKSVKKQLEVVGMSPFELEEMEFRETGFYARGRILPTLPLFRNTPLEAELEGGELRLLVTLSAEELALPGPVQITDSTLVISAGTDGFNLQGEVGLAIERVGTGQVSARAGSRGMALRGGFDFDTELFDQAHIEAWYEKEKFGAAGTLSIGEGKIKGIASATVKARYEEEKFSAEGEVKPAIPAVKEGKLAVAHDREKGLSIAGALTLGTIPGFSGGSLDAKLEQRGEGWKVQAAGRMTPAIPGVAGEIAASYEDGGFLVKGSAGFEKGMLKGSLTLGASNQAVGPDGLPAGPPTETLTLFGSGSATLRLSSWLQASATIAILPNGELAVTGEVGLPAALTLFDAKRLDKELFRIGIDIPILGFSVAGQRVGIFANITGGVQVGAGIGPGQLTDLSLKVEYNPSHEDQTRVHGKAKLVVPADAGLRLFVRAGIGAGLAIISAQGGLELGGMLGLSGALEAGVDVDWAPGRGLAIDAKAELYAEPKLRFDLRGFFKVEADMFFTTIDLYSKEWQLAALEVGSGLRLGVKFPVQYEEGRPLDLSLCNVEFIVPQIEPRSVLDNLVKQVV